MNITRWKSAPNAPSEPLNYHYPRLRSKNGIRLARINAGSLNKGVTIELVDSFVPLSGQHQNCPEYDALSYTWGTGKRDKSIWCNGRRLAVTQTLLEALKQFRDAHNDVTLWVDQLSICQDAERVQERNQQVQLMGKIFMGARRVLVWLGGHEADSEAGMQLAKQLLGICRYQRAQRLEATQLETYGLPGRGTRRWKALGAILRRPWFWRTWIVQEVVLNPNVELVIGNRNTSLRWEDLEAIVELLEGPPSRQWQTDPTMSAWDLPFSRINRIRHRHQRRALQDSSIMSASNHIPELPATANDDSHKQDLDLLDLLLISRDLGATDPRDKVYALLGLSSHDMIPDYEASPEHVFNEFALDIVGQVTRNAGESPTLRGFSRSEEVRKALIMLSCAGMPNQKLDIPSFVPDWTTNLISRPLIFDSRFAAGGEAFEIDWDFDTGLQICSKLVDTVAAAGTVLLGDCHPAEARHAIDCWWIEAKNLAGMRSVRSPGSTVNLDAFQALCRDLSLCEHGYYKGDVLRPLPTSHASDEYISRRRGSLLDDPEQAQDNGHDTQQTLTLGPTRGRVFCVTTTGYLGLVPYGTLEGDLIHVVLGASIPFVFRPRPDGAFTLIGEAYVQGIMGGELLAMDQWSPVTEIYVR